MKKSAEQQLELDLLEFEKTLNEMATEEENDFIVITAENRRETMEAVFEKMKPKTSVELDKGEYEELKKKLKHQELMIDTICNLLMDKNIATYEEIDMMVYETVKKRKQLSSKHQS